MSTVHPRRRGEHLYRAPSITSIYGSSPQARGTRHHRPRMRRSSRFIPAGAGNTSRHWPNARNTAVHPRRRGEHSLSQGQLRTRDGSSPQARGTRRGAIPAILWIRFIPAGAGNTMASHRFAHASSVHPRRRGEHVPCVMQAVPNDGSSPQARGTLVHDVSADDSRRFIPAGAGNTAR